MDTNFEGEETGLSETEFQRIKTIAENVGVEISEILKAVFGCVEKLLDCLNDDLLGAIFKDKQSYQVCYRQIYQLNIIIRKIIPKARSNCGAYLATLMQPPRGDGHKSVLMQSED